MNKEQREKYIEERYEKIQKIATVGPADRFILKFWLQGLTCQDISTRFFIQTWEIRQRIRRLRKELGEDLVPLDKDRPSRKK